MLYAEWDDPEINIDWGQFQPQNMQHEWLFQKRATQELQ